MRLEGISMIVTVRMLFTIIQADALLRGEQRYLKAPPVAPAISMTDKCCINYAEEKPCC